jgi:G3E family GTPase
MLMGSDRGAKWKKGEPRTSRMVFIGKDMPREVILQGLAQCLVDPVKHGAQTGQAA